MVNGFDEPALKNIFSQLDYLEKKSLTYSEFIAGYILSPGVLSEDKIKASFRVWDIDKDGIVSPDDFKNFVEWELPMLKDSKFFLACLQEVKADPSVINDDSV